MPTILKKIPFDDDLLPLVIDFDCSTGDPPEVWEHEINEWIRADPTSEDGARYWLSQGKGTQVWLYSNEENDIVGYGSLCPSRWPDPSILEKVPTLPKKSISLLPAVGLNRRFRGGPPGVERPDRYSTKIISHLVHEARQHMNRQPFLGLYVHPQNQGAIKLYDRLHFREFHHTWKNPVTGVVYPSMILKLAEYPYPEE